MPTKYDLFMESGDNGIMLGYPQYHPYVLRDQSARTAEDTIMVVLQDIVDVLTEDGLYRESIDKATELVNEADQLNFEDDEFAYETLHDILQSAEQIHGIIVDWNGDFGTVTISLARYWEEQPDWDLVVKYLKKAKNLNRGLVDTMYQSDQYAIDNIIRWVEDNYKEVL